MPTITPPNETAYRCASRSTSRSFKRDTKRSTGSSATKGCRGTSSPPTPSLVHPRSRRCARLFEWIGVFQNLGEIAPEILIDHLETALQHGLIFRRRVDSRRASRAMAGLGLLSHTR